VIGERGIAGRSGGEEFTFLLDDDLDRAIALIEALRVRIAPVAVFEKWVDVTLSFGVAQADDKTLDLEQLLSDADGALYDAKSRGRNCVVVAGRTPADGRPARRATPGSLVVVGCGIQFSRHASERTISEIQRADTIFSLADSFSTHCIRDIRSDTFDLTRHYANGKDRRETYREMEAEIMAAVRSGKQVCAVFYGHPGVFADVPHRIMRLTREAGLEARMEPGISAEACLFADIGIDPGRNGLQSMESTWFLINDVALEPASLVLLWQVALTGDLECQRFHAEPRDIDTLVEKLLRWYPADHQVILYEAARMPLEDYRADRLPLIKLPQAVLKEYTTLVIPPVCAAPESAGRFATAADDPPADVSAVANATD
jgi:siroheme synthase